MSILNKERILALLRENKAILRERFSVRSIGLFGSLARGEAMHTSDIDKLVEQKDLTLDHYMDLKLFVQEQFGRSMDLVLADAAKRSLRPIIEREVACA